MLFIRPKRNVTMEKKKRSVIGFLLTLGILMLSIGPPVSADTILETRVVVFSRQTDTILISALKLDSFQIEVNAILTPESLIEYNFTQYDRILSEVDVILVDRFLPSNLTYLYRLVEYINGSRDTHGLIMFGILNGTTPDLTPDQVSVISPVLPVELALNYGSSTNDSTQFDFKIQTKLHESIQEDNFYLKDIPWTSVGAISYRTITTTKALATPILVSIDGINSLIAEWSPINTGTVMFFSMEILEENLGFTRWPYFNYLIFACTLHTNAQINDTAITGYAEWEYSPVPKGRQIIFWFCLVGALWIASFLIYFTMRKKTQKDPRYNQANKIQTQEDENI